MAMISAYPTQLRSMYEKTEYIKQYLETTLTIVKRFDMNHIADMVSSLQNINIFGGRLFILGVGGSAAHASHAVNDFRKLCNIETYAPTDNVSELTARVNDEGWETSYSNWLLGSNLTFNDALLVISVGGGDKKRGVSLNLVKAMELATSRGANVLSIVGPNGGYASQVSQVCIKLPAPPNSQTPHTEGLTSVVLHLLASHPLLQKNRTTW